MTFLQLLGYFLLASPLIALFIFIAKDGGIKVALCIFGVTFLVVGILFLGAYLAFGHL